NGIHEHRAYRIMLLAYERKRLPFARPALDGRVESHPCLAGVELPVLGPTRNDVPIAQRELLGEDVQVVDAIQSEQAWPLAQAAVASQLPVFGEVHQTGRLDLTQRRLGTAERVVHQAHDTSLLNGVAQPG